MSRERPISVVMGEPRPGTSDDFVGRPPITRVYVACDPDWSADSGRQPRHNGKIYRALIDTGAEAVAIDEQLATEIGAKLVHAATVHIMTGNAPTVKGADVQIVFPEPNVVFSTRAVALGFKSAGQTYDLLLGRSFLQHCRLAMDGARGLYQLDWLE